MGAGVGGATDTFSVVLPAPPAGLSPNARLNRWRRTELRHAYQAAVLAAVLAAYPRHSWPRLASAHGTVTFAFPDRRRRDIDNLFASLKCAIDVLVRLGVIADDGPECIPEWSLRYRVDTECAPGVLVLLYGRLVDVGEVSG